MLNQQLEPAGPLSSFRVGQRVRHVDSGHRGTVRYIGPLVVNDTATLTLPSGSRGELWVGVEWDDPVGKHDGEVKGHRYFTTARMLHASMLKGGAKLAGGVSLVFALIDRYSVPYETKCTTRGADPFFRDPERGMAFVNVRNADGAASSDLLAVESASNDEDDTNAKIDAELRVGDNSSPQCTSAVGIYFPNLTSVNLSKTLVCSWTVVADLCLALPALKMLSVGNNRFDLSSECGDSQSRSNEEDDQRSIFSSWNRLAKMKKLADEPTSAYSSSSPLPAGGLVCPPIWSQTLTSLDVWNTQLTRLQWMELVASLPSLEEIHSGSNPLLFFVASYHRTCSAQQTCAAEEAKDGNATAVKQNLTKTILLDDSASRRVAVALTSTLKFVSFEQCDVSCLDDVVRFLLDGLPTTTSSSPRSLSIERMNLSGNKLASLEISPTLLAEFNYATPSTGCRGQNGESEKPTTSTNSDPPQLFKSVRHLLLRHNRFEHWDDVTEPMREHFPSISELHLSHCPVIAKYHADDQPTTLRKKMISILPMALIKLNNSVVTPNERFGIERFALHEYLAPYQQECGRLAEEGGAKVKTARHDDDDDEGPEKSSAPTLTINETALAALKFPKGVERFVRKLLEDQFREAGAAVEIHVPKPRYLQTLMPVDVVHLSLSFAEAMRKRLHDGFHSDVLAHREAWCGKGGGGGSQSSVGGGRTSVDVRWTVGELEHHLCHHVGLSDVALSAGARGSDLWSFADLLLRRYVSPTAADAAVDCALPINAKSLFPSGSVMLFHIDAELMENEGARKRGMHCKHLVRHPDKLHQFRVNEDDAFVIVLLV